MSIQSQIDRVASGISDAMAAVEEQGVEVAASDSVSTLGTLIRRIGRYPTLTAAQRSALVNLATDYWNKRSGNVVYTGGVNRNDFADGGCFAADGRLKLNCSTFVQLLWAGITADTLIGKSGSYTGALTKAFGWGYWFQFPFRKFYHLTAPNGNTGALTMYGYVQPEEGSYEGAYSITTYYSPNGAAENDYQFPKSYMTASDMARELKFLGCEIPLSEAMAGDIVFLRAARLNDGEADETENAFYMNINHVAIITNDDYIAEGNLTFMECSPYYSSTIGVAKISHGTNANAFRASDITDRIVMVARHPAAFGITGAVPDAVTTI